jgi:hypothetical protein
MVPIWVVFMFSYGILIETRVFGELIPLVVCSTTLICEEMLVARVQRWGVMDMRTARARLRARVARIRSREQREADEAAA